MRASFVDLRKKSGEIIRALERKEEVVLFYRGRRKAVIKPLANEGDKPPMRASEHPAFGMWANREDMADVSEYVRRLRRPRFDAKGRRT